MQIELKNNVIVFRLAQKTYFRREMNLFQNTHFWINSYKK